MGPKRKPKDETKKTKHSKSENQVLLFQFFPNMNQNKSKVYQNILSKPNAVLKQEKKLSKEILSEENQIIKEINNLFRQIFQNTDHEEINRLAELFMENSFEDRQNLSKSKLFLCKQKEIVQRQEKQNKFESPIKKTISPGNQDVNSSIYTITASVRKEKMVDLTHFIHHESQCQQTKTVENVRCERKYSETYISPERTYTFLRQPQSKSQRQILSKQYTTVDWSSFEFNAQLSSFKPPKRKNNQNPQVDNNQILSHESTWTNKNLSSIKAENTVEVKPSTIIKTLQNEESQTKNQNQSLFVLQQRKTPLQFTKIRRKEQFSALKFESLDIGSESSIKNLQHEKNSDIEFKLKFGIQKIIEIIQKKEKAKEEQANFRKYVQQVKQKQVKVTEKSFLSLEQDIFIDSVDIVPQLQTQEEKVCLVKREQNLMNSTEQLDILECILNKQNSEFTYYFEGELQSDEQKQVNHLIKEKEYQIEDQLSTKQQTSRSSNSIQSSRFVDYIDSFEPLFDLPEEYLTGYSREAFNPRFFRQIHEMEMQKALNEAKIQDKFI